MVLECVEGLGVGLEVEFGLPMVTVCVVCVRVVWVKDRVGGGDWLLRSRCTCGGVLVVCEWVGGLVVWWSVV